MKAETKNRIFIFTATLALTACGALKNAPHSKGPSQTTIGGEGAATLPADQCKGGLFVIDAYKDRANTGRLVIAGRGFVSDGALPNGVDPYVVVGLGPRPEKKKSKTPSAYAGIKTKELAGGQVMVHFGQNAPSENQAATFKQVDAKTVQSMVLLVRKTPAAADETQKVEGESTLKPSDQAPSTDAVALTAKSMGPAVVYFTNFQSPPSYDLDDLRLGKAASSPGGVSNIRSAVVRMKVKNENAAVLEMPWDIEKEPMGPQGATAGDPLVIKIASELPLEGVPTFVTVQLQDLKSKDTYTFVTQAPVGEDAQVSVPTAWKDKSGTDHAVPAGSYALIIKRQHVYVTPQPDDDGTGPQMCIDLGSGVITSANIKAAEKK